MERNEQHTEMNEQKENRQTGYKTVMMYLHLASSTLLFQMLTPLPSSFQKKKIFDSIKKAVSRFSFF